MSRPYPRVNGVGRNGELPSSLLVYFDRPPTDDEMRAFCDLVTGAGPGDVDMASHMAAAGLGLDPRLARAVNEQKGVWPAGLSSGVMFWDGLTIYQTDFARAARALGLK
jgi:hypothetical protein